MDILKYLANRTAYSKEMQRYYLACIDEFGDDFKQFIEALVEEARAVAIESDAYSV